MRKTIVAFLMVCGLAALAGRADGPDPEPPTPAGELKKLQGRWAVTKVLTGTREGNGMGMTYTFDGDSLTRTWLRNASGTNANREGPLKVRIDTKKAPHTIELVAKGREKGTPGIFKVENGLLYLALAKGDKAPADFSGKGGQVLVMKKEPPAKRKPKKDRQ